MKRGWDKLNGIQLENSIPFISGWGIQMTNKTFSKYFNTPVEKLTWRGCKSHAN